MGPRTLPGTFSRISRLRWSTSLTMLIAIVGLTHPARAAEPVTSAIGSLTVGSLISDAENAASRLLDRAGAEAEEVVLQAAVAVELAVDQLRAAYADSLDKTVASLDRAERDTLVRVLATIGELEAAVAKNLETVSELERGLSDTVRRLPLVKNHPSILAWSPLYTTVGPSDSVRVTINGRNLDAGDPFAMVRGNRLEPITEATDQLVFAVPVDLLSSIDFKPLTLHLALFHKQREWLVLTSLARRDFRISIFTVPQIAGVMSVYGKRHDEDVVVEERTTRNGVGCHAPHCERCSDSERVNIPEPNATLVMSSPRINTEYENSGQFEIVDVTQRGFTMKYWPESYGCGPFWKGTRGQIRAHVKYSVELRTPRVDELALMIDEQVRWGQDVRLDTSRESIETVAAVLSTMLGGTEILSPGETGRFLRVHFDRGVQELRIEPRPLNEVFRSANPSE